MKILKGFPILIFLFIFSICILLISQAYLPKVGMLGSLDYYISHLLKSIVVMIWGVIVIKIGIECKPFAIVFGILIFIIGILFFIDSILGFIAVHNMLPYLLQ
jgi:hypothetical protein